VTLESENEDLRQRYAASIRAHQAALMRIGSVEHERDGLRDENRELKVRIAVLEGLASRSWWRRLFGRGERGE
jgi:hypothetical protein